ncbi:hypothetical protein Tco_0908520 [Tanacetum coccineum]|uniref:Uncharacterized protein n=1 Tax=Tanacetum coccineum TaxID=301880 RepID=A0ABQ5CMF4_9ASTR
MICEQAWSNHTRSSFRNPTAHDMEVLIKSLLMPLSIKTINDSYCFVHELKTEMHEDFEYVESLEKEIDELESEKADFSNIYDLLLEECVSKDVICSYLHSLSDLNAHTGLQCLYLHKVKECECLAQKLSKQTESVNKEVHNNLLKSFSKLEKHSISLELALQQCKEQMKNNSVCKENGSNVFRKEREQYHEIQDLKAQMQDKNIAISELKKLIEKCKGKSVETQFDKPSVVRQPNAQRIPKPSVLGKPTPFSNSPEMRSFQTKQSVNKTNVSDGLFKQVTQQNLPQIRKQAVRNTNVIAPGPSRNCPKHVSHQSPREKVGSNDMVHNYYLEKAKKSAQLQKDKDVNGKPSMIDPARLPNTANGCKPKPRNWQASMNKIVFMKFSKHPHWSIFISWNAQKKLGRQCGENRLEIVDQTWFKHTSDYFRVPTAHDMELLIKTFLMPLSIKSQNDSFRFEHELKTEMHEDYEYVKSLEKEVDELESEKADFSNMYDLLLEECVSKDVTCSYLHSLSDLNAYAELQCLYLHKVKECECLAQKLSKQTESVNKEVHNNLLKSFAKLEKHSISLELSLQHCKEQMKNNPVCKENASNVFRKEREQYHEIQDLKAQMQDKNMVINELKKLILVTKGKSVETQFDKPSVVRQPNAQRIPKQLVLGKPTPFSNSPEMRRVNHLTSVSIPQLKCYQVKDKVVPNNSQVKFTKKEVEDHHRISSISKKTKSVTAYNDSSNSRTSNVNAVCAECGKCVFNSNHDACVSKYLNNVNARTKKPKVVPISASKLKRKTNKSVTTSHKKTVASDTTIQKPKSYFKELYENTNKAWKWWIEKKCPSEYKWTQTTPSRPSLKWKPMGRIFCNVRLRWIPTGKLFNSCTGKVDSEPTHGSIVDIPHIHACKQTMGLSACTSFNGQKQQRIDLNADALYNAKQENLRFKAGSKVVPLAVKTATSRQELELLFHHHIAMLRTTALKALKNKRNVMDKGSKESKRSPPHNLRQKPGQYICCQNHKLIADIENDIMDPVMQCTTLPSHSGFSQQKLVSFVTEIHTLSIDISLRDR